MSFMGAHHPWMKKPITNNKMTICNGYCVYEYDANLCMGCGLTLEEISAWSQMMLKEKKGVAQVAQKRLQQFREKK